MSFSTQNCFLERQVLNNEERRWKVRLQQKHYCFIVEKVRFVRSHFVTLDLQATLWQTNHAWENAVLIRRLSEERASE